MNTPPFKASLPTQKHPFDEAGKVLVNKEWYLALLGLYKQVAISAADAISVVINDEKGIAGTPGFAADHDFTPNVSTEITLSEDYGSAAHLFVNFDGTPQGSDQFSLTGKVITFNSPIPEGVEKVYVKGILVQSL